MNSLSIVLPFFNESGSVEDVLMEVKKFFLMRKSLQWMMEARMELVQKLPQ